MISAVICVGNPFDGLTIYVDQDGRPFDDNDEAIEWAEKLFKDEPWCLVDVVSIRDLEEGE